MGEVWRAEDTVLHRHVAVKLLPPVLANEQAYLKAFTDEARMAAALEHPHILPVHDFGEITSDDEVVTYLIMQLVEGGSLRQRMSRAGQQLFAVEEALNYLRQAAMAIDYAHSNHIIHRDIKPANMLLQENWLFLTDFGISKLLSSTTHRSHTHAGAGTPQYMAPEQIQGQAEPASDLYSLAITAYQLLTGRVPFQDEDPIKIFVMHIQNDPPAPRQFNPHLSEAMERTILRGIAKRPADRPSSCLAFVTELEQGWQRDTLANIMPADADPEATLLAPWSKRAKANYPTQLSATRLDSMETVIPASDLPMIRPGERPLSTNPTGGKVESEEVTNKQRTRIKRRAFLIGGVAALAMLAEGGYLLSTFLNKQGQVGGPTTLIAGQALFKLTGHSKTVKNARWSPQGQYLATGGEDAHVMLWNIDGLKATGNTQSIAVPERDWAFGEWADNAFPQNHLAWSPDGQQLAVLSAINQIDYNHEIALLNVFVSNARPAFSKHASDAELQANNAQLAWSPIDNTVATLYHNINGDHTGAWKINNGIPSLQISWKLPDDQSGFIQCALDWTKDGANVMTLNAGGGTDIVFDVLVWAIKDGKNAEPLVVNLPDRAQYLSGTHDPLQVMLLLPSLKGAPHTPDQFVTTNLDSAVVYDLKQKKILHQLGTDDPAAHKAIMVDATIKALYEPQMGALAWSPNGRYIAGTYISSSLIYVWDLQDPHPRKTRTGLQQPVLSFGKVGGHSGIIYDLSWSPDGRYVTSASDDKTVIVWKVDGSS
ncbi:hypothetical protein KDAU_00890 [Dictyobacter aurantiacus]|uniref:non-specific serine/threonine protein kinase n=2 Tax=Dictyobacter aurantiacus TaxID=1936993 RepID=A0A401Z7B1_9CHLR|nr:hypothetical protein KDAU_00890 [Dictyobacter aurantiacus]